MASADLLDARTAYSETQLSAAPHRIGEVTLVVRDLDRVSRFYQTILGLRPIAREPDRVRLGTGDTSLLELRHDAGARPASRREAGLFHTAFLLPDREALGSWLAFASREGVALTGAADHLVSEAVYLNDPEGNGIEIYADRPSSAWQMDDGMIEMTSDPLDLRGLVAASAGRDWIGFPEDGVVGHVHLQVGDLAAAEAFYRDLLGFEITCRYPGATFYGSGGYHHQLASNIWNSRGAPARADRTTGLAEVELLVSREVLGTVLSKISRQGLHRDADGLSVRDPWGTLITLRSDPSDPERSSS